MARRGLIATLLASLFLAALMGPAGAKAPPAGGHFAGLTKPSPLLVTCKAGATSGKATFYVQASTKKSQFGGTTGNIPGPWLRIVASWTGGSVTILKLNTWSTAPKTARYPCPAHSGLPGSSFVVTLQPYNTSGVPFGTAATVPVQTIRVGSPS